MEIKQQGSHYSAEFHRKLSLHLGNGSHDLPPKLKPLYDTWYQQHTGLRSEWFRRALLWRMEKVRPLQGLRILDFGCGTGCSTEVLSEAGATVVGVDPDQGSLDVAVQRIRDLNLSGNAAFFHMPSFTSPDATLGFNNESFDMITLIGVLEHMKQAERIQCIHELTRLLKENGEIFIFDTPNRLCPFDEHTTRLWFASWLPLFLSKRYAIFRGRFDENADYERHGAPGITLVAMRRLFPSESWSIVQRKEIHEVREEYAWLLNTYVKKDFVRRVSRALIDRFLLLSSRLRVDPSNWTPSHLLCLRKVQNTQRITRGKDESLIRA